MNNDRSLTSEQRHSIFFKAMMTGLFIGIIDTLICLSYNIAYRDTTGYVPSEFINVSSLIFAINILLLVIGLVYFAFLRMFGKKDIVFVIVFLLLTAFFIWKVQTGHRFEDEKLNAGWHGLLGGIILILGLSAASIPLWYRSGKFEKYVL